MTTKDPRSLEPCGSCLTAEFADDDSDDDEKLLLRPGSSTGHLKRPAGSLLKGDVFAAMAQAGRRQPYTYCGRPIGDDWSEVAR